jgi:hypothetical protein
LYINNTESIHKEQKSIGRADSQKAYEVLPLRVRLDGLELSPKEHGWLVVIGEKQVGKKKSIK